MKKVLALVLAAVMALSLASVVSAAPLGAITPGLADLTVGGPNTFFGEDAFVFMIENTGTPADTAAVTAAQAALAAIDARIVLINNARTLVNALTVDNYAANWAAAQAAVDLIVDATDAGFISITLDATSEVTAGVADLKVELNDALAAIQVERTAANNALTAAIIASANSGDFTMGAPLLLDGFAGAPAFMNTGDFSLSVSVTCDNADVVASYKLIKNDARNAVGIEVSVKPIAEKFTVEGTKDYKVNVKVVQKNAKAAAAVQGEYILKGTIENTRAVAKDSFTDASGNYILNTLSLENVVLANGKNDNARVIDESVFDRANGKALTIEYKNYTVKFTKVSKQNTSLYLYAKTGVVEAPTKSIASIAFQPTRVKDAATITMPISFDNQNLYGETVYVYALVNGKPSGEAIPAEVVNHNSVVFSVPAGTALGTFAAYGDKVEGEAEKPAIPETGANDIVNIAIVFAVVALAAAGFVAVKKASK